MSFQRDFPHMVKITHVLSSPLRRTLETSLVSLTPVFLRGIEIIVWKDLREYGKAPCNDGTPLAMLKEEMKELPIKWSLLKEGYVFDSFPYLCNTREFPRNIFRTKISVPSQTWALMKTKPNIRIGGNTTKVVSIM
jgi:hypothetical protein